MFTFKGITSDAQGVREKQVKHSILPSVNVKTLDLPSMHGGLDLGRTYGMREIEVEIGIKSDSYANMRSKVRQIAKWLNSETLQPLIFSDEPNVQYMARLSGDTNLEPLYNYEETTLKFLVPTPFGEDVTNTTTTLTSGTPINYTGTHETYPTFNITTTVARSDFEISNGTNKVKIVTSLPIGSSVVINCKTGKVTLNGSTIQQTITLDSDFFALKEGSNTLTFSTGATVNVVYKRVWL